MTAPTSRRIGAWGTVARVAVGVLGDAALLCYGGSMLVAAMRGYAGCEVLAVSNRLLRRDDEVGCAPFWALDRMECRRADDQKAIGDRR